MSQAKILTVQECLQNWNNCICGPSNMCACQQGQHAELLHAVFLCNKRMDCLV